MVNFNKPLIEPLIKVAFMQKLLILFFDQSETNYSENNWFTGDKQGTLKLLFCVVNPLHEQILTEIVA